MKFISPVYWDSGCARITSLPSVVPHLQAAHFGSSRTQIDNGEESLCGLTEQVSVFVCPGPGGPREAEGVAQGQRVRPRGRLRAHHLRRLAVKTSACR